MFKAAKCGEYIQCFSPGILSTSKDVKKEIQLKIQTNSGFLKVSNCKKVEISSISHQFISVKYMSFNHSTMEHPPSMVFSRKDSDSTAIYHQHVQVGGTHLM